MQHPNPQPTLSNITSASTPISTPTSGLNKDLEIRRRYTIPLASETHDLPTPSALTDRLLPTCYEEGLPSGPASPLSCVDLLTSALELFIKETLTATLGRTRSDAPVSVPDGAATSAPGQGSVSAVGLGVGAASSTAGAGVMTARYRRALEAEEAGARRGELKRSDLGLLPCEVASARAQGNGRGLGLPGDMRIAAELGDAWLDGMMPWLPERLFAGDYAGFGPDEAGGGEDDEGVEEGLGGAARDTVMSDGVTHQQHKGVNGLDGAVGVGEDDEDAMDVDPPEWTWQGGRAPERTMLASLLDDCLAVG